MEPMTGMNDFVNHSEPTGEEPRTPLNLNASKWPSPVSTLSPISPLSFAFMSEEERAAFKFTGTESQKEVSKTVDELEDPKTEDLVYEDISSKFPNSIDNKCDSEDRSSISPSTSNPNSRPAPKTFKINDLLIVDDDDEPMSSPEDGYEPKAHIGWASFGESIHPPPVPSPPRPTKISSAPAPQKRKVYIVRQPNRDKAKPYHIANRYPNKDTPGTSTSPTSKTAKKSTTNNVISDSDADVDVVGIDEDEARVIDFDEIVSPPDLPPQSTVGSRYGFRSKRDYRRAYESDDEDLINLRYSGSFSPPPQLEPQTTDPQPTLFTSNRESSSSGVKCDDDSIEKRFGELNPSQPLKTGDSTNPETILPLSKSIMERKKVALEMTRNAVIKKPDSFKSGYKNKSCAPRDVQIPAYTDKAPVTLYSNVNKSGTYNKDYRGRCVRCRDKSPVDMSTFKFVDDSTVVSVRAHLCDQTRVMIARTAIWNREYAKRLGDRATGTVWQKPDEVTAQMTGFCSATIRRCIEIANLSIVPRCADRIGVSKHELASLKTTFGTEKFFGQTMKTPHVLTQYYSTKTSNTPNRDGGPPPMPRLGRPPVNKKDEEEERKHHPLTNYQPSTSLQSSSSTAGPSSTTAPLKKSVLRWTSLNSNPRILRAPPRPLPRIAVYPVMKKKETGSEEAGPSTSPIETFKTPAPGIRKRGRPKKPRPTEMMLRPRRRETPMDREVRSVVESIVSRVSGGE